MTNFFSWPLGRWSLTPLALLLAGPALAQTLSIQGTGGSSTANDVTAFVDKVEIVRVSDGAVMASALANASFETSGALGNGTYGYNPTGGSWTFANNTGIQTTGSNFGAPTNPDGTRGAFIQNNPGQPSVANTISQALSLAAGTYQVRFQAAQRGCCSGVYNQGLRVLVGSVQIGAVTPPSNTSFASYTSSPFTVTASGTVATNNALAFDGTDDYVHGTGTLPNTGEFTLEGWVNPSALSNQFSAFVLSDNFPAGAMHCQFYGNNLGFTINGNSPTDVVSSSALPLGQWSHVAVVYSASAKTVKFYVNGVLNTTGTYSTAISLAALPYSLGGWFSGSPQRLFSGKYDEVRMYSAALTQAQVQADMFSTTAAVPASLKAYYNFDQGTAAGTNTGQTSLTDQSGTGNTGTLTNFGLTGTASNFVRSFPTITAIAPASGPTGTSVQVTGTNLNDATSFGFNGAAAASTTVSNDFAATVSVPSTATTGPVSVASATLTKYNGPAFTLASTNNALAFDGSNDYVALPNTTPVPTGSSAYTLEAWIKPTAMGVEGIIGWGNWGVTNQVNALRLSPDGIINYWWGPDLIVTTADLSGRWHHVAATFNGTTRTIYLDGMVVGSDTPGSHTVPTPTNLRIGSTNNGEYFNGSIDEVRVYSTGLTQAQVQADMYSTTAAVPGSLMAYYNFDQGTAGGPNTGATTLPNQANSNPGTLTNFDLTGTTSNWVRSFPTITGITPTSGAVGTSVSVTGTNLNDATSFAFNGTNATSVAVSNDLSATVTVPSGATTGLVSLASAALTKYNGPLFTLAYPDLVISTPGYVIPNGIYNNITVASGGSGIPNGDVTVNTALVVQNGGTLADGCSLFVGSGSFTLQAGGTLNICRPRGILSGPNTALGNIGAVRVLGTRSFSPDASYVYSGGQSQDTGDGLPSQVRNFTVSTSTDISLTSPLAIAQMLTLNGAGNLTTAGNTLTLLSNSAGTALVVNSGTGTVVGAATVQRYIDGSLNSGAGYRHYSVPVTGTTLADFTTSGFTPVLNSAYNSSATPATVTPFPTLFVYNQSVLATATNNLSAFDKGWLSPASLSNGTTPGIGYCVNISAGQVVDFVGTLYNSANQVFMSRTSGATAADGGWALLGNPYPAPLDLSLVQAVDRNNLDAATYVVQSTGQYAGGYRAYVNGMSTTGSNNPLLAMGQGFFARVSAGQTNGSFTFRNAQRVTTFATQAAFQRTTSDPRPQVRLELAGAGLADGWVTYVETGATPNFDSQLDAGKLPNSTGLNLSSVSPLGENLAIDGYPAFTASTVLPLAVGVPAAGTYTLSATALNNLPAGLDAYLRDNQTGQQLLLAAGTSYSFSMTAAQAATLLTGRFTLLFRSQSTLATVAALAATDVTVYPNPAHTSFMVALPGVAGASTVQAELLNTLGQVVRRQSAALPVAGTALTIATADLAPGVYVLRLQAGATTLAKRVVVQ